VLRVGGILIGVAGVKRLERLTLILRFGGPFEDAVQPHYRMNMRRSRGARLVLDEDHLEFLSCSWHL